MRLVEVRRAEMRDIPAITAIYRPFVLETTVTFEIDPPDEAEMAIRLADQTAAGFPFLVAEFENQPAGYAYAAAFRTRAAFRGTVENSIYVAPEMQRQGVGRALLGALIGACAESGFQQMIAVIGDSDKQDASIALHDAMGFRKSGRLEAPSDTSMAAGWMSC